MKKNPQKEIVIQAKENGLYLDKNGYLVPEIGEAARHWESQFPFVKNESTFKSIYTLTKVEV